jgi:hypothetical protein
MFCGFLDSILIDGQWAESDERHMAEFAGFCTNKRKSLHFLTVFVPGEFVRFVDSVMVARQKRRIDEELITGGG